MQKPEKSERFNSEKRLSRRAIRTVLFTYCFPGPSPGKTKSGLESVPLTQSQLPPAMNLGGGNFTRQLFYDKNVNC